LITNKDSYSSIREFSNYRVKGAHSNNMQSVRRNWMGHQRLSLALFTVVQG